MQIDDNPRYFLLGVGFIGGTILQRILLQEPKALVSALVRSDEQAQILKRMGVRPVKGDLNDVDLISKEVSDADVSDYCMAALLLLCGALIPGFLFTR